MTSLCLNVCGIGKSSLKVYSAETSITIHIHIKTTGNTNTSHRTIDLTVNATSTIGELKKQLSSNIGHAVNKLRLIYKGIVLIDNNKTLEENGIENNSAITAEKIAGEHNNTSAIPILSAVVKSETKVGALKEFLSQQERIDPQKQCLMYKGQILDDERKLSDYGIDADSILDLVESKEVTGQIPLIPQHMHTIDSLVIAQEPHIYVRALPSESNHTSTATVSAAPTVSAHVSAHVAAHVAAHASEASVPGSPSAKGLRVHIDHKVMTHKGNEVIVTEHTFTLTLKPTDPLHKLKQMLFEKEGLVIDKQRLLFDGTVLDDDAKSLDAYGINSNSIIKLDEDITVNEATVPFFASSPLSPTGVRSPAHLMVGSPLVGSVDLNASGGLKMRVHRTVMTLDVDEITTTEQTFTFLVRPTDTIHKMKELLFQKEQLEIDQQRLLFNGAILEQDDRSLESYGIDASSELVLEMTYDEKFEFEDD